MKMNPYKAGGREMKDADRGKKTRKPSDRKPKGR